MESDSTIVVTGAAGFIGSCLVGFLNNAGFNKLLLVDDFSVNKKEPNLEGKNFLSKIEREKFFEWLKESNYKITIKRSCKCITRKIKNFFYGGIVFMCMYFFQ